MPVYIELFHGRKDPSEDLKDWGEDGPVLGPLKWVHTTYLSTLRACPIGEHDGADLTLVEAMLYYDGKFYGDWSIISDDVIEQDTTGDLKKRLEPLDQKKVVRT